MNLEDCSEAAQKQWNENGTDDYKYRIKSCSNCFYWEKDYSLIYDYAYNACTHMFGADGWRNTKFDFWCPNYAGPMEEPNLVYEEYWTDIAHSIMATTNKRKA